MNLEVNQKNLYLFLPSKLSWMAEMLVDDTGMDLVDALRKIYLSKTYKQLEQEKSKMWHLGPVALYENFIETEK